MGQFTLFTYVRPFLETVTQSVLLVCPDIADNGYRRFYRHAAYYDRSECPILSYAGGYPVVNGRNCRNASAGRTPHGSVAVLLSLWGLLATAAPTGWWTWIARTLPEMRRRAAAADGRRDPAIDSPRVNGRRHGV